MNKKIQIEEQPQIIRKYVAPVLIATIRQCGDAKSHFEHLYHQIGEIVCGPPFSLFIDACAGKDKCVACCYPIQRETTLEEIQNRALDGGEVLSIMHYGPHTTLGESWEVLFDYIERHNIAVKGPRREIYLRYTDIDAGQYVTELQVPLNIPASELPM